MWQRQLLTIGNSLSRLPQAVPDKLLGKDSYCLRSVLLKCINFTLAASPLLRSSFSVTTCFSFNAECGGISGVLSCFSYEVGLDDTSPKSKSR